MIKFWAIERVVTGFAMFVSLFYCWIYHIVVVQDPTTIDIVVSSSSGSRPKPIDKKHNRGESAREYKTNGYEIGSGPIFPPPPRTCRSVVLGGGFC
jgi:hypothetical protein